MFPLRIPGAAGLPAILSAVMAAAGLAACGGGNTDRNHPPLASDKATAVAQDLATTVALTVSDADGDPLTIEIVSPPAHGQVVGTAPSVTYTPASGFIGMDGFTYRASDGKAWSSVATVTLKVTAATGQVVPGGGAIDGYFVDLLDWTGIDAVGGASVAIAKDGKLVYARGFGWADAPTRTPFAPGDLCRFASISKMITMVATMHLVEQGALSLSDRLLDRLPAYGTPPKDSRVADITLRQVLGNASGLRVNDDFDPMFRQGVIAQDLSVPSPPTCAQILDWGLHALPLDFAPGTSHGYSNLGFCALGLVVAQAAGQDYQAYVRDVVLAPMGVHDMRFGASHWADRAVGEVTYSTNAPGQASVFPGDPPIVPWPYGFFSVPTMEGTGGWIGSAVDLTRLLNGLEGRGLPAFLSEATLTEVSTVQWPDYYPGMQYGLGIMTGQEGGTRWWGHAGNYRGTRTMAMRSDTGWAYAMMFNSDLSDADLVYAHQFLAASLAAGFAGSPTDLYPSFPSPELGPYTGP